MGISKHKKILFGAFSFLTISGAVLINSQDASANAVNDYVKQGMTQKGWKSPAEKDQTGQIKYKYAYANGVGRPTKIINHETANPNSNINGEISYMIRNQESAFVHEFVDANNIIGIADTDYLSWGAGPQGNATGIQVEQVRMHSKDDFSKEIMNLATFNVMMLKQYGLQPTLGNSGGGGSIWTHAMVTRYLGGTDHMDPDQYWSNSARTWFNSAYTINDFNALVNDMYYGRIQATTPAKVNATTKVRQEGGNFIADVTVSGDTSRITQVQVPTWSATNGQKDLVWYQATKVNANTYRATIPVKNHKKTGDYIFHTYVATNDGKNAGLNSNSLKYNEANVKATTTYRYEGNKLVQSTKLIGDTSRVSKVEFATWRNANQSDLVWNKATKVSADTWEAKYDLSKGYGWISIHTYVETDGWQNKGLASNGYNYQAPAYKGSTTAKVEGDYVNLTATISDGDLGRVDFVEFPTWSENDKKTTWHKGTKVNNNTWTAKVNLESYKQYGKFTTHSYVKTKDGKSAYFANNSYEYKEPNVATATNVAVTGDNAKITVNVTGDASRIKQIQVPTWSATNGQKDLVWYTANKVSDSKYETTIDMKKHNVPGKYLTDTYVTYTNGAIVKSSAATFNWGTEANKPNDTKVEVKSTTTTDKISTIKENGTDKNFYTGNPPLTTNGGKVNSAVSSKNEKQFRTLRETILTNGETYSYGQFNDGTQLWVNKKNLSNEVKTPVQTSSTTKAFYGVIKDDATDIRNDDLRYREASKYKDTAAVKASNSAKSANVQITKTRTYDNGETWYEFTQSNKNGESMGWVNSKYVK